MTDTPEELQTEEGGSPETSPRTEGPSGQTSDPVAATAAEPQTPPPAPPKSTFGIGGPTKPPGSGRTLAMRIGILLVGLLLLGTLFVAGSTLIRKRNPSPTPSPSPSGQAYFPHNDPKYEYSIQRPEGWNTRNLDKSDPTIALVVGPDPPYPVDDAIAVEFHSLGAYYGPADLVPFKDAILKQLGGNVNIVTQSPSPVISGLVGYYFVWTFPAANPTGLHAAYYLLDGDRYDTILLQVMPATDTKSFEAMLPIFQQMAQTFKSFHHAATPTAPATPSPGH